MVEKGHTRQSLASEKWGKGEKAHLEGRRTIKKKRGQRKKKLYSRGRVKKKSESMRWYVWISMPTARNRGRRERHGGG